MTNKDFRCEVTLDEYSLEDKTYHCTFEFFIKDINMLTVGTKYEFSEPLTTDEYDELQRAVVLPEYIQYVYSHNLHILGDANAELNR